MIISQCIQEAPGGNGPDLYKTGSPPGWAHATLSGVDEMLYLTGRPALKSYLRFVANHAVEYPSEGDLVDEWYAAREIVQTLEREESGAANGPTIVPLEPEEEPLLLEFLKDPVQRSSFNTVPAEVAIIELDTLVVYQKHIDVTHCDRLAAGLAPSPAQSQIFRTCLPYDHPSPPVKWSRVDADTWVFMSPSNDLRFLGAFPILSEHANSYATFGTVLGGVMLGVGFGSNFLNAIHVEDRLILHNGSHRAYTLRKLGVTHVPCIVQHVPSRDALDSVAPREVRSDADLYLRHPRPPMLRDYFDPRLCKVFPFERKLQQITVRFETTESFVPGF